MENNMDVEMERKNCCNFENFWGIDLDPRTKRHADCMDASQIIRNLYLGSYELGASIENAMLKTRITHVLTVGHDMPIPFKSKIVYKIIEINDSPDEDIDNYFEETYQFIDNALKDKNNVVLVHCWAGISRSATIMANYLMRSKGIKYYEALEMLRTARYWINPNAGFRKKLKQYYGEEDKESRDKNLTYERCCRKLYMMYQDHTLKKKDYETIIEGFSKVFGKCDYRTLRVKNEMEAFLK